jgi:hypothetical protein
MVARVQFGGKTKRAGTRLDPALKEFLDAVVIPTLVKEYLLALQREKRLVVVRENVAHSAAESASAEGVR